MKIPVGIHRLCPQCGGLYFTSKRFRVKCKDCTFPPRSTLTFLPTHSTFGADPERQARIGLYRLRASAELPLFDRRPAR